MIANYGDSDGSGAYYITIDTEKCDTCGKCVEMCPSAVLEIGPNEFDPMDEDMMVVVKEEHRKKIKYSCAPCKPASGRKELPCVQSCQTAAIVHSW